MNVYSNKMQQKREKYLVEQSAKSIVALTMFCMNKFWNCKPNTCRKRFEDLKAMLETQEIIGQELHDHDVIAFCKKYLEIDVDDMNLKVRFDK